MSLTWLQTLILALLQGITELFPISSLGHTVVIPGLLGWTALVQSPQFLPIVVAFHLGTSIALVLFFWRDWWRVLQTLVQSIQQGKVKQGDASWVSWLVIIGSLPGGLLGVLLKKQIEHLFGYCQLALLWTPLSRHKQEGFEGVSVLGSRGTWPCVFQSCSSCFT